MFIARSYPTLAKSAVVVPKNWLLSHLQGFCNNAGIYHQTDWRMVVETNLMGTLAGNLLAVEKMGVSTL
jgi:hypothetical protein